MKWNLCSARSPLPYTDCDPDSANAYIHAQNFYHKQSHYSCESSKTCAQFLAEVEIMPL